MKNIRILICLALLSCFLIPLSGSEKLNMFIDYSRFLDKNKNTILLLDYQVPYQNLAFLAKNNGFFAELEVYIKICEGDSLLLDHKINDLIGVRNKADTSNKQKSYLNRFSFIMDRPICTVQFYAQDLNSEKSFMHEFEITALPPNSLLSDIELNSEVRADTTSYLPKFKRNNIL